MGKSFKLKTQNNKKTKKVEEEFRKLESLYVKDKPTTIYPVFFNFNEQWEPNVSPLTISEPSSLWDGTPVIK